MVVELKGFSDTKNYREYDGVSGIYALVHNNQVIYVGQSINVRRRLRKHHSVDSQLRQGKHPAFYYFIKTHMDEISFLVVPCEVEQLNTLEEHYIKKHKPRYNRSGVKTKYTPLKRYVF